LNPKIEKLALEIERTKARITELQIQLPELQKRKAELENLEIVKAVRSVNIAPAELPAFLAMIRSEHIANEQTKEVQSINDSE
jgi:hypothetical protein